MFRDIRNSLFPSRLQLAQLAVLLTFGLCGGFIAAWIGMPLPFMMGGLFASLPMVVYFAARGQRLFFPQPVRRFFIAVIGALIGGTVTPDLISVAGGLAMSLAAMFLFVPLAQGGGYLTGKYIGGYDPATAVFSAMPGGLIEAVEIGTRSGADATIMILHHFLRIVLVVVLVPLGFFVISGDVVGSAGGQSLASSVSGVWDVVHVAALAIAGLVLGKILKLPAHHLVGPLVLSALVHGAGWVTTNSPDWLLFASQWMVGVGLSVQFTGTSPATFVRVTVAVISQIAVIGVIGGTLAVIVAKLSGLSLTALIISFAPGGVSEMGLIALSLSLSPVVVTAHHVLRIFLTVSLAGVIAKRLARSDLK